MLVLFFLPSSAETAKYVIPFHEPEEQPSDDLATITVSVSLQDLACVDKTPADLTVYLCPESVGPEIEKIRARSRKTIARADGDFMALASDMNYLEGKASGDGEAAKKCSTGKEGSCRLINVANGSYLLFVGFVDKKAAGYWLLPVAVESADERRIDLNKENLKEYFEP